jgi:hypothetical protein
MAHSSRLSLFVKLADGNPGAHGKTTLGAFKLAFGDLNLTLWANSSHVKELRFWLAAVAAAYTGVSTHSKTLICLSPPVRGCAAYRR